MSRDCDLLAGCYRGRKLVVDALDSARGLSKYPGQVRKGNSEGNESTEKEDPLEPIQPEGTTKSNHFRRFKGIICSCQPL